MIEKHKHNLTAKGLKEIGILTWLCAVSLQKTFSYNDNVNLLLQS